MNVAWVGRKERAEDEENLAGAVTWSVTSTALVYPQTLAWARVDDHYVQKSTAGHFKPVLNAREAFGVLIPQSLYRADMLRGVSTHVTYASCKAVAQTEDGKLRDGILLKELLHELLCVSKGKKVSGRPKILFHHRLRQVQDQH